MNQQTTRGKQPARQSEPKRTISITLGVPAFVTSLGIGLAALVWVFILGVIIGRGHKPEDSIPELSRIMPQTGTESAENAGPARVVTMEGLAAASKDRDSGGGGMMTQEDLNFHSSVRNSAKPESARAPQPPAQAKKPEQVKTAEQPKKPETAPARAESKTETQKPADPAKPQTQPAAKEEDKGAYSYVYQVAAYKEAGPADAFAAKLNKSSILARTQKHTENNVTWYRVMVDFKGTPEDTRKLRSALEAHGISRIILRDKKPVK